MIKGAIFDVDGTILDSMAAWDDVATKYLKLIGIQAAPDLEERICDMSFEEGAAFIKREYGLADSVKEIMAGASSVVESFYSNEVCLKDGAKDVLQWLSGQNIKMVTATTGDRRLVDAAFRRNGILNYFEKIFTCAEVGVGKAQPDIYLQAAEYLGFQPEEVLVFEDAFYAAETAKKAGFHVIGVHDSRSEKGLQEMKKLCDMYCEKIDSCIGKLELAEVL